MRHRRCLSSYAPPTCKAGSNSAEWIARRMAESLDHFDENLSYPTRAILLSVLGSDDDLETPEPPTNDEDLFAGAYVEVRTRYFPGQWAPGYEIVETLPSGFRIR